MNDVSTELALNLRKQLRLLIQDLVKEKNAFSWILLHRLDDRFRLRLKATIKDGVLLRVTSLVVGQFACLPGDRDLAH